MDENDMLDFFASNPVLMKKLMDKYQQGQNQDGHGYEEKKFKFVKQPESRGRKKKLTAS